MIQRNLGRAADVGNLAKPRTSLCGEFLVIDNLFMLSHEFGSSSTSKTHRPKTITQLTNKQNFFLKVLDQLITNEKKPVLA